MRPVSIVGDDGFQELMKTGRPGFQLPSDRTVAKDVKAAFAAGHKQVEDLLKVSD